MSTTLKGWVFNDDGTVASNLTVTCYDQTPSVIGTTTTDVNGMWQFASLTDGVTYDVKVNNNNGLVRWIKGGEQHQVANLNLTGGLTLTSTWDFTAGSLILPGKSVAPATPAGGTWLATTNNSIGYLDSSLTARQLVDLSLPQTLTNKTLNGLGPTVTGSGSLVGSNIATMNNLSVLATSGNALSVTGVASQWAGVIDSAVSGDGLLIQAGDSSGDFAMVVNNRPSAATFLSLRGDGYGEVGQSAQIQWGPGSTGATIALSSLSGGTISTNAITSSGSIQSTSGGVGAGPNVAAGAGDLWANRSNATGYCWLGNTGSHYVGFDGTNYQMPTSGLAVGGTVTAGALQVSGTIATSSTGANGLSFGSAPNSASAQIGMTQQIGPKISLYDAGAGNFYGFGVNSAELYASLPTGSIFRVRQNNGSGSPFNVVLNHNPNGVSWRFDAGEVFMSCPNGGPTTATIGYNNAFSAAPVVVATINGVSGGDATSGLVLSVRTVGTNGCVAVIDNNSGSSQSLTVNWMAFGS